MQLEIVPRMIRVFNLHEGPRWTGAHEYVGRPSILQNPFVIGKDGTRAQVVEKYRQWLGSITNRAIQDCVLLNHGELQVWDTLKALVAKNKAGDINLVCYCHPLPCHAHVLKRAVEWLTKQPIEDRVCVGPVIA